MINIFVRKSILCIAILALILAMAPSTTVNASWNGTFTLSSATYSVGEAGGTVTVTIKLSGSGSGQKPTVRYDTSSGTAIAGVDFTRTTGTRRFVKAGTWSFKIPITNDSISEGSETFNVMLSNASNGAALGTPDSAVVMIVDNDIAGIAVTPISELTVTEAGSATSFSISLNKAPTANVMIGLSSSDTTEGTVSPASLTFTNSDWNKPQSVIIIGEDDYMDDGDVGFTIITAPAASSDASYSGVNASDVSVTNIDDDTAGISIVPVIGLSVTEYGGMDTFQVVLDTEPVADVSIGLTSDDLTEGIVSPDSITFTSANWNSPQSVTVTGVEDGSVADGNVIFHVITASATSTDPLYNGLNPADVTVTGIDNDTAGISITPPGGLFVAETGATDTFHAVLSTRPSGNVVMSLSSSNTTEGTVAPTSLTFTSSNWNLPQNVTVTGVDDYIDDGDIGFMINTGNLASEDPNYDGIMTDDVDVTNLDDDTAGITISPDFSLIVTEGGDTDTFSVVLDTEPYADVTIGLASSNLAEGTISPTSLLFTTKSWSSPQTVTITGVNDSIDDGDIVFEITTSPAVSTDLHYSGMLAGAISVTNIDNDVYGITITPHGGLSVTEAGGTAVFSEVLDTQPTADVVIDLSSSDPSEGTVYPSSLIFTNSNWNSLQTVTITGVDDFIDDGNIDFSVISSAATSNDANYDAMDTIDLLVTNLNDDDAGITVSPVDGLIVTEAGGTDTFTVELTSEPVSRVSINLSSSDMTEGTVSPVILNFTGANWDTPQTITVTGMADGIWDGDVLFTIITTPANSADPKYEGMDPDDVLVTNRSMTQLFIPLLLRTTH